MIGTTQTETPFLNEGELPECARLNRKRTLESASGEGSSSGNSLQAEEDRLLAEAMAESQKEVSGGGGSTS